MTAINHSSKSLGFTNLLGSNYQCTRKGTVHRFPTYNIHTKLWSFDY